MSSRLPPRARPAPDDGISRGLHAHLAAAGLIDRAARLVALAGGQTNRLWKVTENETDLVVKLYARDGQTPLFANDPAAEAQMLRHLDGTGLAPDLHATLDTSLGPALLYRHVPGAAWGAGPDDDPRPVAMALARLHRIAPPAGLLTAPDGSTALADQTHAILDLCSETDRPAADALRVLQPRGSVPASGRAALLHGDPVPGNLIQRDAEITLIDWQCPAQGDPAHDLALFLSPAMQLVYRGRPLTAGEEERFLGSYADPATTTRYRALAPWVHWRMAAYCLWRVTRRHVGYEPALVAERARLQR